jgi:hypothetical protein
MQIEADIQGNLERAVTIAIAPPVPLEVSLQVFLRRSFRSSAGASWGATDYRITLLSSALANRRTFAVN